jgi:hypothetical protein
MSKDVEMLGEFPKEAGDKGDTNANPDQALPAHLEPGDAAIGGFGLRENFAQDFRVLQMLVGRTFVLLIQPRDDGGEGGVYAVGIEFKSLSGIFSWAGHARGARCQSLPSVR